MHTLLASAALEAGRRRQDQKAFVFQRWRNGWNPGISPRRQRQLWISCCSQHGPDNWRQIFGLGLGGEVWSTVIGPPVSPCVCVSVCACACAAFWSFFVSSERMCVGVCLRQCVYISKCVCLCICVARPCSLYFFVFVYRTLCVCVCEREKVCKHVSGSLWVAPLFCFFPLWESIQPGDISLAL